MFSEDFPKGQQRTKPSLEKLHVLRGLPERATKNQTFYHHGHLVVFADYIAKNPSFSGKNPKCRIRSHRHPRAFDARRPFAKARTRRSTHPQRAIRVREIVAPVRTRNQRSKHSPRRSDRPTNSRPSFPKAEVKPRPAPNIRSRSSPASTNAV